MAAYQILKDLFTLAKMKEMDPIDPGNEDLQKLGIANADDGDVYSWVRPDRVFALTEGANASHELVWVKDRLRRRKRKVVRFGRGDVIDSILIRKKAT